MLVVKRVFLGMLLCGLGLSSSPQELNMNEPQVAEAAVAEPIVTVEVPTVEQTNNEQELPEAEVKKEEEVIVSAEAPAKVTRKVVKTLNMRATAYTANDAGMNGKGKTYTGTTVTEGRTISVDPRVIPLGSKVEITCLAYPEVDGIYIAEDTGSAIKGNIIDMYMATKKKAFAFGRRDIEVKILGGE